MSTIRVVNVQHTDATEPNIVLLADGTSVFASGITISGGTNLTVSGIAEFASGTVIAPGITFIDDNNTGLYSPAPDTVAITTATVERLRVDSNGRLLLGISTNYADSGADDLVVGSTSLAEQGITIGALTSSQIRFADASANTAGYILYNHSDDAIAFGVSSERMRIDSAGRLLVGTITPGDAAADNLTLSSSGDTGITIRASETDSSSIYFADGTGGTNVYTGAIIYDHATNHMSIHTNSGTEQMRIDSSGRVLINHNANTAPAGYESKLQLCDTSYQGSSLLIRRDQNNSSAPALLFAKTRSGSKGGSTIVQANDLTGQIHFFAGDGTDADSRTAIIESAVDGTPGSNDMPGRLAFYTTSNGAAGSSERMRIDSSGKVGINTISPAATLSVDSLAGQSTVCFLKSPTANSYLQLGNSANDQGYLGYQSSDMTFYTAGTEQMRIDSSGKVFCKGNYLYVQDSNTGFGVSDGLALITDGNSDKYIWNHENTSLRFGNNNTEKMRLDSSGRLLLGTTTEGYLAYADNLTIADSGDCGITIRSGTSNQGNIYFSDGTSGSDEYEGIIQYLHNLNAMSFGVNDGIERMRIDSSGQVNVLASSTAHISRSGTGAGAVQWLYAGAHSASSMSTGTISFQVYTNGNVQNTNDSYGQISDIKLKENIVDAGSQWDDFKAVRFRKYNFKEETGHETHTQLGVIAQELELTSPGLVYETPDFDGDGNDLGTTTKAIKSSILTKKGLVALQEAMARIEQLETEVAALKNN
jgi:hypothetical protein